MAAARARHALAKAGLDPDVELTPMSSVTNEVWVAGDYVVRVNRHPVARLWREATLASLLPADVGCPEVISYGGIIGADWMITRRIEGEILARCWHTMNVEQRRSAVAQIADRLRLLHGWVCPETLPELDSPQLLQGDCDRGATEPLLDALDLVQDLEHVDPVMVVAAKAIVREAAPALEPLDTRTFVHGDLHFENLLWDGERITALLDFEWSRPAPPDLELDVFLRFCAYPFLHVAADYEHLVKTSDYADVPWWMAEEYGELFAHEHQLERVRTYSIAYDVRDLLLHPPDRPVDQLSQFHPYHRLAELVAGTSHLDRFAATAAA